VELDEKVRRRLRGEFWERVDHTIFGIRRKDQKVGFREGR
jgi:hypothetical protein